MGKKDVGYLLSKYRVHIMGVATLWIMMFHVWHPVLGAYRIIGDVEEFLKRIGFCGVDIFLLVSGFGLVSAVEKYDLITFYKRRFWNVYPPFFFAAFGIGFFRGWEMSEILKKVTFVMFFTENMYDYLWYVPAIFLYYLLFPVYYQLFKKCKNKYLFTGAAIVLWYFLSIALDGILRPDFYGMTNRIPVFLVGVLIGWLAKNRKIRFTPIIWLVCLLMLGVGGVTAYLTTYKEMYLLVPTSNCFVPNFLMAISLCLILVNIFELLYDRMGWIGIGILRVLVFFGSLSLPLYCIQEYIHTDITRSISIDREILLNIVLFICIISAGIGLYCWCRMVERIKRLIKDM